MLGSKLGALAVADDGIAVVWRRVVGWGHRRRGRGIEEVRCGFGDWIDDRGDYELGHEEFLFLGGLGVGCMVCYVLLFAYDLG